MAGFYFSKKSVYIIVWSEFPETGSVLGLQKNRKFTTLKRQLWQRSICSERGSPGSNKHRDQPERYSLQQGRVLRPHILRSSFPHRTYRWTYIHYVNIIWWVWIPEIQTNHHGNTGVGLSFSHVHAQCLCTEDIMCTLHLMCCWTFTLL